MQDKVFLDTNIILYSYSSSEIDKCSVANKLIFDSNNSVISKQVINETINILFKKYKLSSKNIEKVVLELRDNLTICDFDVSTQIIASKIKQKHQIQFYDALIVATAIQNNCTILYSEDMQHSQTIDGLKIINPFI
jgi:predicted nucleic acid-binding protein